jgi:hypothetical protein
MGPFNRALRAGPLSPLKPATPFPAAGVPAYRSSDHDVHWLEVAVSDAGGVSGGVSFGDLEGEIGSA